jgi:hypothetical protein
MVADKMAALTEAQVAAAVAVLTGDIHKLSSKVLQVLKKRVRANKNRLSNQRGAP